LCNEAYKQKVLRIVVIYCIIGELKMQYLQQFNQQNNIKASIINDDFREKSLMILHILSNNQGQILFMEDY